MKTRLNLPPRAMPAFYRVSLYLLFFFKFFVIVSRFSLQTFFQLFWKSSVLVSSQKKFHFIQNWRKYQLKSFCFENSKKKGEYNITEGNKGSRFFADDSKQDSDTVLALIKRSLQLYKQGHPEVKRVYIRSDNGKLIIAIFCIVSIKFGPFAPFLALWQGFWVIWSLCKQVVSSGQGNSRSTFHDLLFFIYISSWLLPLQQGLNFIRNWLNHYYVHVCHFCFHSKWTQVVLFWVNQFLNCPILAQFWPNFAQMSQSVSFKIPTLDSNWFVVDAGCHTRFKNSQFFVLRTRGWKITLRHGTFWVISSFIFFIFVLFLNNWSWWMPGTISKGLQMSGFGSLLVLVRNSSIFCFNPVRICTHLPVLLVLNNCL